MYDGTTTNKDHIIKLEKAAKWLKVRVDNLKRLLLSIEGLEEGYDYVIQKETTKRRGRWGHNKEHILLTTECFKILCMMSRTEKGQQVRRYYLELEFLPDRYKEDIIKGKKKRISDLENNQKPKYKSGYGVIYIIIASGKDMNVYKIGKTKDLNNRLNGYNSGTADDVKVMFTYETNYIDEVEKCIKLLLLLTE